MAPDFAELFAWCDLHASRWRTRPVTQGFLSGPTYYDKDGFPIPSDGLLPPVLVWASMMERHREVARDELPDGSCLSTVWLGLDHGHGLGPPLIFETMRFSPDGPPGMARAFPDPLGAPGEET